jgi:hypothetical protein
MFQTSIKGTADIDWSDDGGKNKFLIESCRPSLVWLVK